MYEYSNLHQNENDKSREWKRLNRINLLLTFLATNRMNGRVPIKAF